MDSEPKHYQRVIPPPLPPWCWYEEHADRNGTVGGVLGSLFSVMQCRGFDFAEPLIEGIFLLELGWVLTPSPKTFGWEYKVRSNLCAHAFRHTDPKDPIMCVNASNKNTPSMHHSWRQNVTISMVGLRNGYICKNLTQNCEPQKYSWECRRKRRLLKMLRNPTGCLSFGVDFKNLHSDSGTTHGVMVSMSAFLACHQC